VRVLQVLGGFFPARFGGTMSLCHRLSKELVNREHEVFVYATDADIGSRLKDVQGVKAVDGIKVRYFRNISNWLTIKFDIPLPLGMGSTVKREIGGYDVIHLHVFRGFHNMVVHHYARKYNIPYVLDAHGSLPRTVVGGGRVKWLVRWLFDIAFGYRILRDASRVVAETEVGVNEYKEFGVPQGKIILLPPPFATEEFSVLPRRGLFRRKYNIDSKHIVMFLGRIHWIKRIDILVRSFYELSKRRSDVVLVIVGPDNGYKPVLDGLIDEMNLSHRVLFTGFLKGQDKLSALVDADVVVQTSVYEQGAWAPFEVILCGTPIIVSDNSGAGEDVEKIDAGYLVKYGDVNDLKDKIQYVLDNPAEARRKARRAKKHIESNRSFAKEVELYEGLYQEVIEECK